MKKLLIFFCLFTLVGLFFALRPVYRLAASWNWEKASCTIISSELKSGTGNNQRSYRVAATYSYRFADRDYISEDFDFSGADYGSHGEMKEFLARFPPGRVVDCRVNPNDPAEAVVYRGVMQFSYFGILITGILFLTGFALLIHEFIKKPKGEKNEAA